MNLTEKEKMVLHNLLVKEIAVCNEMLENEVFKNNTEQILASKKIYEDILSKL